MTKRQFSNLLGGDAQLEPQDVPPSIEPPPVSKILKFKPRLETAQRESYGRDLETQNPGECAQCNVDLDKTGVCPQCGRPRPVVLAIHGMSVFDPNDLEEDR